TVTESSCTKIGSLGMSRVPGLAVGGYMAAWNDDGIALDRFIMHYAGMAGGTPFLLSTSLERLHVLTMAHDQTHLFHRRREIARRHLGHAKDMTMATETDCRIHFCLKVVCIGRRPQEINGGVFGACPDLIAQPPIETGPHMARNTTYVFMGGLGPAL